MPKKGHVAFISQSGALCTSVLDWALEENIGFSYFISVGNAVDVDFGDLIDYVGEDEETKSIILYIESIGRARKFMTAARAFARTKPIVAYKAGRFPESARVAVSHTGAMVSEDAVYGAAFRRCGLARVYDIGEIFDVADLIGRMKIPRGSRLGIVTNAGGPGVMATDALVQAGGKLADLSGETIAKLDEILPPFWSRGNPVDVLGDARPKRFAGAAEAVLADPNVDSCLAILTPQAMTNPTESARAIARLADTTAKPILASWLGGQSMHDGVRIMNEAGIATFATPEQGVRAFMTLVDYARNLERLYETPRDVPVAFTPDRSTLREELRAAVKRTGPVLSEALSKRMLEMYGIPVTRPERASSAEEAVSVAGAIGYPVVLKVDSPDVTHKSDVGGVALDLTGGDMVREAFRHIVSHVAGALPGVRVEGVTVQRMASAKDAIELILGARKDPVFGSVIMIGSGGTAAELLGERILEFPPLNERLARQMLQSLKTWPLFAGYRGKKPLSVEALLEVLIRFSYLVAEYPEIAEIDINPLLVTATEVVALDARAVLDTGLLGRAVKPYSHLALRPYPEEYVRASRLADGTPVTLRPIRPEDEHRWMSLLASCSRETIYSRFQYFFQWSHEVATRYCYIDYDREIAIVAELTDGGDRKLLGVGRLAADPDLETAEYAVLVSDAWQGKALGSMLTDYCIEIAARWGVKRIVAQTTSDNHRMLKVFRKRGFTITGDETGSVVEVSKTLEK
jgi:acetyltransferase